MNNLLVNGKMLLLQIVNVPWEPPRTTAKENRKNISHEYFIDNLIGTTMCTSRFMLGLQASTPIKYKQCPNLNIQVEMSAGTKEEDGFLFMFQIYLGYH